MPNLFEMLRRSSFHLIDIPAIIPIDLLAVQPMPAQLVRAERQAEHQKVLRTGKPADRPVSFLSTYSSFYAKTGFGLYYKDYTTIYGKHIYSTLPSKAGSFSTRMTLMSEWRFLIYRCSFASFASFA
jgi:hypothetical protein